MVININLWGKKNSTAWNAEVKSKKENHINIHNEPTDSISIIYEICKDIAEIKSMLSIKKWKETENARKIKELNNKVEKLTDKVFKLANEINLKIN